MRLGLYFHLPFCLSKCPYCSFAVVTGKQDHVQKYAVAALKELEVQSTQLPPHRFSTVYFGGGTPSATPSLVHQLLNSCSIEPEIEITSESNPCDRQSFGLLRKSGVNRLSIGVQSFDDAMLRQFGRRHSAAHAIEAISIAKSLRFNSVSLDLMFGGPKQTMDSWKRSLEVALRCEPHHMSLYGLHVYEDTPFGARQRKGTLVLPAEDVQAEMYNHAIQLLAQHGYQQYEISNFALPGHESQHNMGYWKRTPYLGVGMGAHSFIGNKRWGNTKDFDKYLQMASESGSAQEFTEVIDEQAAFREQVMLGLRLNAGVAAELVQGLPSYARLVELGLLELVGEQVVLTGRGRLIGDTVAAELV